jgi:hypothetical protein
MQLNEAKNLMAAAQELNAYLNQVAETLELLPDEAIQKQMKLQLGLAMGKVYTGFMHPAIKQFPELDPDSGLDN